MSEQPESNRVFDGYAACYDEALARGISVSGEAKEFFARGRLKWLARCLRQIPATPRRVLDFGCGTGSAVPLLCEILGAESAVGVDVSAQSVDVARRNHGSTRTEFVRLSEYSPRGEFDLVLCNGVFHHIPPAERAGAVRYVYQSLRPGGLFALWENNPWNPGTRYVMSRIPFDRDAIMVTPPEARTLLQQNGFGILRTDFQFIFPRALKWLRGLESRLARWPLGAQYQVLSQRARQ
jgi:SAM-dependent methyltransferase